MPIIAIPVTNKQTCQKQRAGSHQNLHLGRAIEQAKKITNSSSHRPVTNKGGKCQNNSQDSDQNLQMTRAIDLKKLTPDSAFARSAGGALFSAFNKQQQTCRSNQKKARRTAKSIRATTGIRGISRPTLAAEAKHTEKTKSTRHIEHSSQNGK